MSSLTRNLGHKRQKCSNDDVDRITNLPESVLSHILSLLPTKEAVATSLISKRWKFLWKNIHNLNFDDRIQQQFWHPTKDAYDFFVNFVTRVLISLNRKCIEKFSLEICNGCEDDYVTTWINDAVSRNVKVLEFFETVSSEECLPYFELPCSLFTCKTLEVLYLSGYINLNVPSLVFLPNLKTLRLINVIYKSDECFRKFISGCPLLETLYIDRDINDKVVNFTIASPTLRNLTFKSHVTWEYFPKEFECKLVIDAPALRYLCLYDSISRDFYVEKLCFLDEAKVTLSIDESLVDYDQYSKAVAKLVQGLYNVKNLSLMGDTLKALSHAGILTSFPRLSQLTVRDTCCKWNSNSLLNLFEGSNKLELLRFSKEGNCGKVTHGTCWRMPVRTPVRTPICLLSCLKTMSIDGFQGLVNDIAMVAYILKNAKVLRTMTINVPRHLEPKARCELLHEISKFPRGSEECEVHFLDHTKTF